MEREPGKAGNFVQDIWQKDRESLQRFNSNKWPAAITSSVSELIRMFLVKKTFVLKTVSEINSARESESFGLSHLVPPHSIKLKINDTVLTGRATGFVDDMQIYHVFQQESVTIS